VIELRTRGELEAMRAAGHVVAGALEAVRREARVGTVLRELDEVAGTVVAEAGATPVFPGYHPRWAPFPYPSVVCVSVNDVIVHGIPGGQWLSDGDLVSVDLAVRLDGWCGDAAVTFPVGAVRPEDSTMVTVAEQALADGINAARVGNRVGDIARAVGVVCRSAGYGIPGRLGGHGIGRDMHEEPFVPNDGRAGTGLPLRPGMVLAIEPMLLAGGRDSYRTGPDGWSVCTGDGSRAAHVEHTVAVTDDGPMVLTV
jgi:methionyl aminopeptidase